MADLTPVKDLLQDARILMIKAEKEMERLVGEENAAELRRSRHHLEVWTDRGGWLDTLEQHISRQDDAGGSPVDK